tara:strand:- start:115 stop:252 length:138 start_codon:yes stop_codon:yes gene_type:complete
MNSANAGELIPVLGSFILAALFASYPPFCSFFFLISSASPFSGLR